MEKCKPGWRGKKAPITREGDSLNEVFAPDRLRQLWSRAQENPPATTPADDSSRLGKRAEAEASRREMFDSLRAMVTGQWAQNSAHLAMLEERMAVIESMLGQEKVFAAEKSELVEQLALLEDLLESLLLEGTQ